MKKTLEFTEETKTLMRALSEKMESGEMTKEQTNEVFGQHELTDNEAEYYKYLVRKFKREDKKKVN